MDTEDEIEAVRANLTGLQNEFLVTDEWGVFNKPDRDAILELLKNAANQVDEKKLADADDSLMKVCLALNSARRAKYRENHRAFWYRVNNYFGLFPLLWTFGLTAVVYRIVFVAIKPMPIDTILQQPAFWGLVGAYVKSLYWLQKQIGTGTLRPRFYVYFMVAPTIGVGLGGALWLATSVGFRLFSKDHAGAEPDPLVIGLLAFFGGFNWDWALKTIETLADRIRSTWQK